MERVIGFEIKKVDNMIVREVMKISKEEYDFCLSPIQTRILKYLIKNKEVYQKDVETFFGIRRSTVSGILDTMEKNNLIKRESIEGSRSKKIVLTDEGYNKSLKMKESLLKLEEQIVKDITDEELTAFFMVIDKIKNNLNERENK